MGISALLRVRRLRLMRFGGITEKRGREFARDCDQLALDRIEKFVKTAAQHRRYVECAEQDFQSVELLSRIIAAAQRVPGFDLAQQPADLAHAMVNRTRERSIQ